jgi:hypothetical protein
LRQATAIANQTSHKKTFESGDLKFFLWILSQYKVLFEEDVKQENLWLKMAGKYKNAHIISIFVKNLALHSRTFLVINI